MPIREPPDPLDAVLRPPLDETPEEKAFRMAQEAEARRVSAAIDESIRQERVARRKAKAVRLLLLGQSESGKSTTLRQFQRLYTPSAFREERVLWRAIVQLNVVRSVNVIVDALLDARPADLPYAAASHHGSHRRRHDRSLSQSPPRPEASGSSDAGPSHAHAQASTSTAAASSFGDDPDSDSEDSPHGAALLPPHLTALLGRLQPLRHAESLLMAALSPAVAAAQAADTYGNTHPSLFIPRSAEMTVRPGSALKRAMRCMNGGVGDQEKGKGRGAAEEAQAMLNACAKDLVALWRDPVVREVLKRRRVRVEEGPGFFLDDLERVTAPRYLPSDNDVLKARLKTVGVSEYTFEMEAGSESGTLWRIIDVGGARSQRQTWVPFFDDVNAIIFLAPISCFDQTLAEDRSVNRLEDSVLLWKSICSNKLLARVDIVLFLNKCDILAAKLASGVRLAKYVRNFGERPNEPEVAEKYFRSKFTAIHREYSPIPRKFYGFCTSVTDSTTTGGIIASVRDMVIRESLRSSKLL